MSWGAVIAGAATLVGGYLSSDAAGDAAAAQGAGYDAATRETARQYDQTRQDMMPWMDAGGWALGEQRNFLNGDYSAALKGPDYLAAFEQGMKGLDRQNAANLSLTSGGADADRIAFGGQVASQYIGNHWNRLAGLSNTGQTTAAQLGNFGANAANQIGQNAIGAGNARGSSYINQANAWNNALQGAAGAWGYYQGGRG